MKLHSIHIRLETVGRSTVGNAGHRAVHEKHLQWLMSALKAALVIQATAVLGVSSQWASIIDQQHGC